MLQLAADVQMNIENHDRTVPGTDDEKFTDDVFASSVVIGRRHGACCDCVVAYKGTDTCVHAAPAGTLCGAALLFHSSSTECLRRRECSSACGV